MKKLALIIASVMLVSVAFSVRAEEITIGSADWVGIAASTTKDVGRVFKSNPPRETDKQALADAVNECKRRTADACTVSAAVRSNESATVLKCTGVIGNRRNKTTRIFIGTAKEDADTNDNDNDDNSTADHDDAVAQAKKVGFDEDDCEEVAKF